MAQPFISEIRVFAFTYAPQGWAQCNGQLMAINTNQALFSLLGTTYGGDGITTFALPNLQARVPLNFGNGVNMGDMYGEQAVTLTTPQMPAHNHGVNASSSADTNAPQAGSTVPGSGNVAAYGAAPDTAMNAAIAGNTGGSQPHDNMQPYLVLNYCIALQGIFPSRN